MDPLSMAASVAGLISLTMGVSRTISSYCRSVNNARKDVQEIAQELEGMYDILHQLDELLRSQQLKTKFFESSSILYTAIILCGDNIRKLSSKVHKMESDGLNRVWEKLKWPFSEKEMLKMLDTLRRCAATFQFSLTIEGCVILSRSSADATYSLEIQLETAERVLDLTREVGTMVESAKEAVKVSNQVSEILRLAKDFTTSAGMVQSLSRDVSVLAARSQESKEMEILSWLSSHKHSRIYNDIRVRRMVGTGWWFLDGECFNAWMNQKNPILWCSGGPGVGKSILTSLIIDHTFETHLSPNEAIAYFYFDYRDQAVQTAPYFFASLLRQLASRGKSLPRSLLDFYERYRDEQPQYLMPELCEAFRATCDLYERCFIMIDALDECKHQAHRKEIIEVMKGLSTAKISVYVTSRPHAYDIKQGFEDALHVEIEARESDIKYYCSRMIEQSTNATELITGSLRQQVIDTIASKAHGIFLLPVLQLQTILDAMTKSEVKSIISNLSANLGQAFEKTLQRIENEPQNRRQVATNTLMWILHARRPLRVDELCHALATKLGDTEVDQDDLLPPRSIIESCSGLIVIDDESSTIRLVHYTLKDFLQSQRARLLRQEETYITKVLITYLCFDEASGSTTGEEIQMGHPRSNMDHELPIHLSFLEYAATNWVHHAKLSEPSEINELALAFLENMPKLARAMQSRTQSLSHPEEPFQHRDLLASQNRQKKTALHVSAESGLVELLRLLLDRGHPIQAKDSYRNTPLHDSAVHGQRDALILLLEYRAKIDAKNFDSNTPLYLAVSYSHEQLIPALLERGATVDNFCIDDWSPLHKAADNGHIPIAQALLDHGASVLAKSARGLIPLHRAAGRGHSLMVELLLRYGSPIDASTLDGWTPLHGASSSGQDDVVKILLQHNAEVNKQSMDERTALHRACRGGHFNVVSRLLMENADLFVRDCNGNIPLHRAAKGGHQRISELLLQQGSVSSLAQLSAINGLGRKPEKEASSSGHWSVATLLRHEESLHKAVDVKERDDLELAVEGGHLPQVTELLSAGADVNKANSDSSVPLHQALLLGNKPIARILLQYNADVIAATSEGWQALHCAASKGMADMVSLCLRHKADIAAQTLDGQTALHKACKSGDLETVQVLLRSGADLEAQDDSGWRPLHTASAAGNQDIVELLIDNNADIEARDKNSCSVQACAAMASRHDLVEYFRRVRYELMLKHR